MTQEAIKLLDKVEGIYLGNIDVDQHPHYDLRTRKMHLIRHKLGRVYKLFPDHTVADACAEMVEHLVRHEPHHDHHTGRKILTRIRERIMADDHGRNQ